MRTCTHTFLLTGMSMSILTCSAWHQYGGSTSHITLLRCPMRCGMFPTGCRPHAQHPTHQGNRMPHPLIKDLMRTHSHSTVQRAASPLVASAQAVLIMTHAWCPNHARAAALSSSQAPPTAYQQGADAAFSLIARWLPHAAARQLQMCTCATPTCTPATNTTAITGSCLQAGQPPPCCLLSAAP
jgi:hypothetical protein